MTGTGKSSTEIVAEAVGAIGPYMAWIANKRAEIQGQIAQMQAAASTGTATDSPLAARLRGVALPTTDNLPTSEGESHPDATTSTVIAARALPQADTPPAPESDTHTPAEAEGAPQTATPAEPVRVPEGSSTTQPVSTGTSETTSLNAPQNQKEAQAHLEAAFAATPPHTLPPVVVEAWAERRSDSRQCAKLLIAAQDAGLLPDALAQAVTTMIAWDDEFTAVSHAYADNMFSDLVGVFPATVQGPDADGAEDNGEGQNEEDDAGDGDQEAEAQYGFPGEDQQEDLF